MSPSHNPPSLNSQVRSVVSSLLVMALSLNAQAQGAAQATTVKLKRGQTLSLSLLTPVDSATAKLGDVVPAKLERPLIAEGAVILPTDWIVRGTVTKIKRAGKKCHDGEIEWRIRDITTANGEHLKVQPVHSYSMPRRTGDPDWVYLDTPLDKIGRVPEYIGLTVFVIVLSPLLIPMAVAMKDSCDGEPGHDQVIPAGRTYLYAVSKQTRVARLP